MHIGEAGAGQVDRLETEIGDDAGGERIGRARQQHAALAGDERAQAGDVILTHDR